MPEDTMQVEENATQGATAEQERVFTQSELEAIIGDRLKRERAKYADYDELKAKAAQHDADEDAKKSELQKAVEERDKYKAEAEQLKADKERAELVSKAAAEHKVDASILALMAGDVEENAKVLAEKMANAPKYGDMADKGSNVPVPQKTELPQII